MKKNKSSTIKAAASSAVTGVILTPFDTIKNRLLSAKLGGNFTLTQQISMAMQNDSLQGQGLPARIRSLYKGVGIYGPQKAFNGTFVPVVAITTAEYVKETTHCHATLAGAAGGATAGISEAFINQAPERLKVGIQTSQPNTPFFSVVNQINQRGLQGWGAGLGSTCVRNLSGATLTWGVFIGLRDSIKKNQGQDSAIGDTLAAVGAATMRILASQPGERMKVLRQTGQTSMGWGQLFRSGDWARGLSGRLGISGPKFAVQQLVLARALTYFN